MLAGKEKAYVKQWQELSIFNSTVRLHRDTLRRSLSRMKQRQRQFASGVISEETYCQSLNSIVGHWAAFDTKELSKAIFQI